MGLNKTKLGKLIELRENRNSNEKYGLESVKGISIQKKFIDTKADMEGVSLKPYLIVEPNDFCYVTVTSRNGEKISLAKNNSNDTYIVSSSYVVFRVKDANILDPNYLFIYFNRPQFDRYSRFHSWGSARETFDFTELCEIDFEYPDIDIQRKYVKIYNSMVANQKSYEKGLDDLKLTCDATIEELRRKNKCTRIGKYLQYQDEKNKDLSISLTQGVDVNMEFIPAKREAEDQTSARIVKRGWFAFNKVMKANGTKFPIAFREGLDCVVSGSYQTFSVNDEKSLNPEYLMMWLGRPETQRYCGFNAWGSTRDIFDFEQICDLKFPVPEISVQKDIVSIFKVYKKRKQINEKLKEQLKNICPILIKGSLKEAMEA